MRVVEQQCPLQSLRDGCSKHRFNRERRDHLRQPHHGKQQHQLRGEHSARGTGRHSQSSTWLTGGSSWNTARMRTVPASNNIGVRNGAPCGHQIQAHEQDVAREQERHYQDQWIEAADILLEDGGDDTQIHGAGFRLRCCMSEFATARRDIGSHSILTAPKCRVSSWYSGPSPCVMSGNEPQPVTIDGRQQPARGQRLWQLLHRGKRDVHFTEARLQVLDGLLQQQPPVLHERHVGGEALDLRELVRGDEDGGVGSLLQKTVHHLIAHHCVEPAQRFVQHQ